MIERTLAPCETDAAPEAGRGADRLALTLAIAGSALLVAAAGVLWWQEGLGVFLEVIIAGISACF